MAGMLPFPLLGLDSDNGSEFISWHLQAWSERKQIQLTRGRPYKKDDNAHIEQKNWTHVRKLLGWERYDTQNAVAAMNDLYRRELRLWLNLYLPLVKLVKKVRVGSKLRRVYDAPKTPFERVLASKQGNAAQQKRDGRGMLAPAVSLCADSRIRKLRYYSSSPSRPSRGVMVPKSPSCSPLMPAVKNRVLAGPAAPSLPKVRDQSPSMVRMESSGFLTKPMNLWVKPLKAAIQPLPKLPTRMALLNSPKSRVVQTMPQGELNQSPC